MPSYYDEMRKSWYCKFYYTDYQGKQKQKKKRGFKLKRDAEQWERDFLQRVAGQPDMPFKELCALYLEDKRQHNKALTYETKKNRIDKWIVPVFGERPLNDITPADVRKWQGDLKNAVGQRGRPLSEQYMFNLFTELSSLFNFAVRFYGLNSNPCHIAGNTVGHKNKSLSFWTLDEFSRFIDTFTPSDPFYAAFMLLYYTGIRRGELLALTRADIDFDAGTMTINKSYNFVDGRPVITPPKTEKSNRTVFLPRFLCQILSDYIGRIYDCQPDTRLFSVISRSALARHLEKGAAAAAVPRIRVHDLRHSHASLLIELGFSAILVSERLGHDSVTTTMNIYAHLFPSKQSEVAEKLDALYSPRGTMMVLKNETNTNHV